MRSALKSYVKVLDLVDTAVSSIQFKDTGGTLLDCNYFSVQCRNLSSTQGGTSGDTGYYFVEPSGVYGTQVLASATADVGAGAGGVAGTADASVEMSFVPPDRTAAITVYNQLGSRGRFVVTYGNIIPVNDQRDLDRNWTVRGS